MKGAHRPCSDQKRAYYSYTPTASSDYLNSKYKMIATNIGEFALMWLKSNLQFHFKKIVFKMRDFNEVLSLMSATW